MAKPEDKAREDIDRMLEKADWDVQDIDHTNIYARQGVAIRNFPLKPGHGFADYVLYINGKAAEVIEAKKAGDTLTGVEIQSVLQQRRISRASVSSIRTLSWNTLMSRRLPMERKLTVSLEKLLQAVALGNTETDVISSIAGRSGTHG